MSYEVFARKYRPQTFDDLFGQPHVSRTLKNAVAQNRLAHAYGTRATKLLGNARSFADLGQSFSATLTESEVRYLMSNEWACTADDVV